MSVDMSIAYMDAGKEKYKTVSEQVDATAGMPRCLFSIRLRRSVLPVSSIIILWCPKKDGTKG